MSDKPMAGFRVLIVEDEMLIALYIEETLKAFGCDVVGPIAGLKEAMNVAAVESFDAAMLDVSIRGELIYPVVEKLLERGIPFVLASGYGKWALPEPMRVHPRLIKPFTTNALEIELWALFKESSNRKSYHA